MPSPNRGSEKADLSYVAGENVKWYGDSGEEFGRFLKTKHRLSRRPSNLSLGGYLREMKEPEQEYSQQLYSQ